MTNVHSKGSDNGDNASRRNEYRFDRWITTSGLYEDWLTLGLLHGECAAVVQHSDRVARAVHALAVAARDKNDVLFHRISKTDSMGNLAFLLRSSANEELRCFVTENWRALDEALEMLPPNLSVDE